MTVNLDTAPVEDALKRTTKGLNSVLKKAFRVVGKKQAKLLNNAIKGSTKKRTGELSKCYTYSVKVNDTVKKVTMYANGKTSRTIYPKLMTLNYGATIRPLKGKTLAFQVDGHWVRVPEVTIRGRHFLEPAWSSYGGNGSYTSDVQSTVMKEVEKYWS